MVMPATRDKDTGGRPAPSLRDSDAFTRMTAHIKDVLGDGEAVFFTNPGNLGDALILAGALELLRDSEIPIRYVNTRNLLDKNRLLYPMAYAKQLIQRALGLRRFEPTVKELAARHSTAIMCGSGGWVSAVYPDAERLALEFAKHFRKVIILPTTYADSVAHFPANVDFFARDIYQSMVNNPRARFCHDTALYLSPEPRVAERDVGYHIRTDPESSGSIPLPPGNVDLSALGCEYDSVELMFDAVGQSRTIVTDRLHVAIAGALLSRDVWLFASRYFKIPAIHRSSLEERFPTVRMIATPADLPESLRW